MIGASGSGKTRTIARLLARHAPAPDGESPEAPFVSLSVPSPATLKFVGMATLTALGYRIERDRPAYTLWQMVREHLRARRTLILHFDEAQDILRHQSPKELRAVVNTLKSLLQGGWPVGVILSGTDDLMTILNHDPQFARRLHPIEFRRLDPASADWVSGLIREFAGRAGLTPANILAERDFGARLLHVADGQFGLLIEQIIGAIEEAWRAGPDALGPEHFAAMFRRRSGRLDGPDPFGTANYTRIDPRRILDAADPACDGSR